MSLQRRHELTDAQWETLAPLHPPQRPATGRPAKDHRTVLKGMLWVLVTEGTGKSIAVGVTAGERHESPRAIPLLAQATARMWPEAVAGDEGYSGAELRNWLQERDIADVIPYRADEPGPHDYDRELYRERPIIERTINRIKRY